MSNKSLFGAILAFIGFGSVAYAAKGDTPTPTPKPNTKKKWPERLTDKQMIEIADLIDAVYGRALSSLYGRLFVPALIRIESSGKTQAGRYEGHLDESSLGLMQILPSTAADVHKRYSDYPLNLLDPESNVYHGYGYLLMLSNWAGKPRSAEWVIRAYNGGMGWEQASEKWLGWTLNHWNKHKKATQALQGVI